MTKLSGAMIRELARIYGPKEAAKRIDHLIGFKEPERRLSLPAPSPVSRDDADRFFQRIYAELELSASDRKQLELFTPEEQL